MQRPVMNPTFYDDSPVAQPLRRRRLLRAALAAVWRAGRSLLKVLTYDPISHIHFRDELGTPASRFARAVMYRLAFVPVLVAAAACAFVWAATHPRPATAEVDPASQSIYYDPVTFVGPDELRLEGWLIPVIEAKTVLQEKERVLRKRYPAVVLAHDMGHRRQQMLPLIRPLHDAGYVVLALNLRGGGARAAAGETFGILEAGDIRAAVELLRKKPFVDPDRIAVVGCGTGATAALLAAEADPRIAAVVADKPIQDVAEVVNERLVPSTSWLKWIAPLCKWTFEISYGLDTEDVQLTNFKKLFTSRPVLMVESTSRYPDPSDPHTIDQVMTFLNAVLNREPAMVQISN
jgi:acetyl esterase/lipase